MPRAPAALRLWMVFALVAAAYVGVAGAGFVWDDRALVLFNRVLDGPTWENVFLSDLWCCTVSAPTAYHRPLLTLTLLLDTWLYGKSPAGFHLTSLLWHLVVVGLVASALRDRVGAPRAAVAALVFGLHPAQSEAVLWISARNDVLAAAGVIGTLVALDRRLPALAAFAAFAACLSKENALLLPFVVWAWRRAWGEKVRLVEVVAVLVGMGAALGLRAAATLHPPELDGADVPWGVEPAVRAAATTLGWVTWPWPLTTTASVYLAAPPASTWLAAVATLGLAGLLVVRGGGRAAWLLALGAGVLLPSAFGLRWYGTLGERYLYLALFGVVSAGAAALPATRATIGLVAAGAIAALGALHVRIPDWATEESLFAAAVRRAPDSYAWNLLGVELRNQGRLGDAVAAFDQAILAEPRYRRACGHAITVGDRGLPDDVLVVAAQRWADAGCKGIDGYDGAHALVLAARGRWAEAERVAEEAVHNDRQLRRDEIVRAAVDARDGDLTSLSARATVWPGGAAELLDLVAGLTLARPPG